MSFMNYSDPAHAWDVYCDMQDRATRAFFEDGRCADCDEYDPIPSEILKDGEDWGKCKDLDEWVDGRDTPENNCCGLYDI